MDDINVVWEKFKEMRNPKELDEKEEREEFIVYVKSAICSFDFNDIYTLVLNRFLEDDIKPHVSMRKAFLQKFYVNTVDLRALINEEEKLLVKSIVCLSLLTRKLGKENLKELKERRKRIWEDA